MHEIAVLARVVGLYAYWDPRDAVYPSTSIQNTGFCIPAVQGCSMMGLRAAGIGDDDSPWIQDLFCLN